ncbi:MAG TPA: ribonuclease H-like domain-containing protein [Candidatus Hydrogenedentes bacterium]|nr:ribonuclease H-like domain-containing protein [Candidatus Hydrogenedentota bacterium]HPG65460.1 ribonuclease H-like domain-containing protein [Candidatus Hydrogenedentota bacterium]
MSDIRKKLDALLAQPGLMTGADLERQGPKPKPPLGEPAPESSSRLKDLLDKHGLVSGTALDELAHGRDSQRGVRALDINEVVPGRLVGDGDDHFFLVSEDFPIEYCHGRVPLALALDAVPQHIALSACDSQLEAFDPATTVFIDTETTGLAGGSGTVPFLVGVGLFQEDLFRLEQCFMRDYDDEEPMLRYLDALFARVKTVVTYNGKSFDIPLLRTRFITHRLPFRLDAALHFDLVHTARRFWKRRLDDCSLGNVERSVLGLTRYGDVPSSEIPQIWFDYLHSRDATPLRGVFYHHKMDILSLVALTGLVSQSLDRPPGEAFDHAEDRLSLVRLYFRQKRYADVIAHGERFLESASDDVLCVECLEMLGWAHKRLGHWIEMEDTLRRLLEGDPAHLDARRELAKLYEHRKRDLVGAERVCREAVEYLETRAALGRGAEPAAWIVDGFRYRLDRIHRKLDKARAHQPETDWDE